MGWLEDDEALKRVKFSVGKLTFRESNSLSESSGPKLGSKSLSSENFCAVKSEKAEA
jgi:hypothetical protein